MRCKVSGIRSLNARRPRRAAVALTAGLVLSCAFAAFGQGTGNRTAPLESARARQATVQTAEIGFRRTETWFKGALSGIAPAPLRPKTVMPAEDTTLESVNRLVLDRDRFRYEDNHPLWNVSQGNLNRRTAISVFDGESAKMFFPTGITGGRAPTGLLEDGTRLPAVRLPELVPLTYTWRGLNRDLAPAWLEQMKPSGTALPIGDSICHEFRVTLQDESTSYWFDSAKDYVLRRLKRETQGHLAEQLDIAYERGPGNIWVPKSWSRNQYTSDGRVLVSCMVRVEEVHVNVRVAASEFSVAFPVGTRIVDNRDNKWHQVQPDGSLREISGVTGALITPAGIQQRSLSWIGRNRWLVGSVACTACVAALWMFRRRAIAKRNTSAALSVKSSEPTAASN
jgi:hypothetical protein